MNDQSPSWLFHGEMPRFALEILDDSLLDELSTLLYMHWQQIARYKDIPLNPNREEYLRLQQAGVMQCFTVRKEGELLGYAVFFVRHNLHYSDSLQAVQDVLYLHPKIRGMTSIKFLRYCDEELTRMGVEVVYHHVKTAHDFGPVLERQGYECVEKIFAKRLSERA